MKKLLVSIIALMAVLASGMSLNAAEDCLHEMTATDQDSIHYEDIRLGCYLVTRCYWTEVCTDCGATFEHWSDVSETVEHNTRLRSEVCDGVMHHSHHACDCMENCYEEQHWCNTDCPIYQNGGSCSYNMVALEEDM